MLIGGSAAAAESESDAGSMFGSFTRPGVFSVTASLRKNLTVRILPAFDMSMSIEDEAFNLGVDSYRSNDCVPDDTNTPGFTSWFYPIMGHTYLGIGRKQFISPLTGTRYYPAGHDPVRDCWKYIDEYITDPAIKQLAHGKTTLNESGKEKKLPGYLSKKPRDFVMMNALVQDEKNAEKWDNAVLIVTQAGFTELRKDLAKLTPRSDSVVITPEWPDFYYGDITHPDYGPAMRLTEKQINTYTTAGFYIEQMTNSPETHNMKQFKVSEEQLAKRYRIFDTTNVTNMPPKEEQYQAILDYLVEDGVVPLDILKAACGQYGTIREELRRTERQWFNDDGRTAAETASDEAYAARLANSEASGGVFTQPAPAPAATPKPQADNTPASVQGLKDPGPAVGTVTTPAPTESAPAPSSKPAGDKAARFAELTAKVQSKEALSPEELQELMTLV